MNYMQFINTLLDVVTQHPAGHTCFHPPISGLRICLGRLQAVFAAISEKGLSIAWY